MKRNENKTRFTSASCPFGVAPASLLGAVATSCPRKRVTSSGFGHTGALHPFWGSPGVMTPWTLAMGCMVCDRALPLLLRFLSCLPPSLPTHRHHTPPPRTTTTTTDHRPHHVLFLLKVDAPPRPQPAPGPGAARRPTHSFALPLPPSRPCQPSSAHSALLDHNVAQGDAAILAAGMTADSSPSTAPWPSSTSWASTLVAAVKGTSLLNWSPCPRRFVVLAAFVADWLTHLFLFSSAKCTPSQERTHTRPRSTPAKAARLCRCPLEAAGNPNNSSIKTDVLTSIRCRLPSPFRCALPSARASSSAAASSGHACLFSGANATHQHQGVATDLQHAHPQQDAARAAPVPVGIDDFAHYPAVRPLGIGPLGELRPGTTGSFVRRTAMTANMLRETCMIRRVAEVAFDGCGVVVVGR